MKNRIKWMLVALGITFGLQVVISLVFTALAFKAASGGGGSGIPEGSLSILTLAFTLGTYLVGAFLLGWMNESLKLGDAILVALATLVLTIVVFSALPDANRAQFVTGAWLGDSSYHLTPTSHGALFVLLSLVSAAIGSYAGWHIKVPQDGIIDRITLLIGLLGAIIGPFVLLATGVRGTGTNQSGVSIYFLGIVLAVLLVVIAVGYFMFTRESRDDEISINPDQQHHTG